MTITSQGYKGSVDEINWARLQGDLTGWVETGADFRVTQPSATTRQVSAAPGTAVRSGVRVASDDAVPSAVFPTPANGQWYLAAIDRNWDAATRASSVVFLPGPTVGYSGSPAALPVLALPSGFANTPGVRAHQALAWIFVSSATAVVSIFDLRLRALAGGLRVGALAKSGVDFLSTPTVLAADLPAGGLLPCSDGITYRWDGTVWKPWDSGWINGYITVIGFAGSRSPSSGAGWVFNYSAYRYVSGKIKVRFELYLVGSAAAAVQQINLALPAPMVTGTVPIINGRASKAGSSDEYAINGSVSGSTLYTAVTTTGGLLVATTYNSPFTWAENDILRMAFEYDPD